MNPSRTPKSPQVSSAVTNPFLHAYFFGIGPVGSAARAPLPCERPADAWGPSRTMSPDAFPRDAANENERAP